MTFQSEVAKELFHKLPTDTQLLYTRMEEMLADSGKFLHVVAVTTDGNRLEILIGISNEFNGPTR